MATYVISGLEGWKSRAGSWGAIGVLGSVISTPPIGAVAIGLLFGALAAAAGMALVVRGRHRFTGILPYVGIGLTIACVTAIHERLSPLAWLSIGSLNAATEALASALLGIRIVKRLNQQHGAVLEILGNPGRPRVPEPPSAELGEAFVAALPESLRDEARAALQPVISARPFRSLDLLPPGHSALSGLPLLDPSQSWPERNGRPLDFLCQLNFADLPASGHVRPALGLLAFFHDADGGWGSRESDLGSCVLLHQPDLGRVQPVSKAGAGKHPPLRKPLRFEKTSGFSPSGRLTESLDDLIQNGDDAISGSIDDLYQTLLECGPEEAHRVLSPPRLIQHDMHQDLEAANRAHGLPAGTEWTLLLQLDSDRDLGWCWGDAGCLYFWIPSDDLALGRFDRSWVILQCT